MSRRRWVLLAAGVAVVGATVALLIFQPWLLWIDVRVDDELPDATAPSPSSTAAPLETPSAPSAPTEPVLLASGEFISHEHTTTGSVTVIERPDGTRALAIAALDTSNGPDLHVWLSAADVIPGIEGWRTAADAEHLTLGPLKGNVGDQLYEIPAGAELSLYRSVTIWCEQFSVSFGAAQLAPAASP